MIGQCGSGKSSFPSINVIGQCGLCMNTAHPIASKVRMQCQDGRVCALVCYMFCPACEWIVGMLIYRTTC
jgi:hypothetical protein